MDRGRSSSSGAATTRCCRSPGSCSGWTRFPVRDGRIDLVGCTSGQVGTEELPREPSGPFKLVVNV